MRFLKRLALWLLLSLPLGVGLGAAFSAYVPGDAALSRGTAAVNGALAGLGLALIGATAAAATTTATRELLERAGGSELLTGAVISYGLIVVGLALLNL